MGKDLKGKELGTGICQKKDGRYLGRFTNRFGKRQEIGCRKLKELKILYNAAVYEDLNRLNRLNDSMLLDEWFESWMKNYKDKTIRSSTKLLYMNVYKNHISPNLGRKRLIDITQLKILEVLNNLDDRGYQYQTQNKVRILLLDMFNKAMVNELASKNPAKGIKLEHKNKTEPRVLSPEEQALFFECSKGSFYDNLYVVSISTGLRPGEVCGLTVEDIDFENMLIKIDKTLLYQKLEDDVKKCYHYNPPKTKASKRFVPINKSCSIAIKKQIMQRNVVMSRQATKPVKRFEGLLFTTKYGTPINSQLYSDSIRKIIDDINLCRDELEKMAYFSGHCFRHSFATRCFEAGIQPKTVQKYLGHATLQMTMDLYTHVLPEHLQDEMIKLDKVLDETLDVSDIMIDKQFDKFDQRKNKDNCIYLSNVM